MSFGKDDMLIPSTKDKHIESTQKEVRRFEEQYSEGLITQGEKYNKVVDSWSQCTDRIASDMMKNISGEAKDSPKDENGMPKLNSIFMMAHSGARGSAAQIKQLAGMRGLMAKPNGDIIETPISPELTTEGKGKKMQRTEDLIGPYELHDFFLYHFTRWESKPSKILYLAEIAFKDKYESSVIKKWLKLFIQRFFANQWKRSVMPDGPKVGSVSLSPRGDWRMPSDAEATLWLKDLDK